MTKLTASSSKSISQQKNLSPVWLSALAPFPIVAIGASAGGLEAIEQFLSQVPDESGMAFVIIQHLDPTRKGMMPELLQRITKMPVSEAKNQQKVEPNHVYVIPPDSDLTIKDTLFFLQHPTESRGLRLPIDVFLRSLAEDRKQFSVAIILSGMGSDGTLGVGSIKKNAGLVMVQDPSSAIFNSMPKSVIDAGLADIIAPAKDLPGRLIDFIHHTESSPSIARELDVTKQPSSMNRLFSMLLSHTGHDFSLYKKSTLFRRIERRINLQKLQNVDDYVHFISNNPQEIDLLFKELLIGVTHFFRNPKPWLFLQQKALPELLNSSMEHNEIRAWVIGCSTGEEAYSLAMTFKEVMESLKTPQHVSLQIFATDIDPDAITKARLAFYPLNISANISQARLDRFFTKEEKGYRLAKGIREMVIFAIQNVIMDPPFTNLDIITCRNLLIYLTPALQKKLLPIFHYSLNPGGLLFLGSAESAGGFINIFHLLGPKLNIYQRSDMSLPLETIDFTKKLKPLLAETQAAKTSELAIDITQVADKLLLDKFAPVGVLITAKGDILYISGHSGKYLEPAAGKVNWNIHAMVRKGLDQTLKLILPQVLRNHSTVEQDATLFGPDGEKHTVNITAHAIEKPNTLRNIVLVTFKDVALMPPNINLTDKISRSHNHSRLTLVENTLEKITESANADRKELQIQREELTSSNEELQSRNEELQSTNEELTTTKEEMQSLNEELQTVNIELQSKLDDLYIVNSDIKNLLESTDLAAVFLDNDLYVRRFTKQATKLFQLKTHDIGRPLSDLSSILKYPQLTNDTQTVLTKQAQSEKEIQTRDNRWFLVKILPYKTIDEIVLGVVITLNDITASKILEKELRKTQSKNQGDVS